MFLAVFALYPARIAAWVTLRSTRYSATNRCCFGERLIPIPSYCPNRRKSCGRFCGSSLRTTMQYYACLCGLPNVHTPQLVEQVSRDVSMGYLCFLRAFATGRSRVRVPCGPPVTQGRSSDCPFCFDREIATDSWFCCPVSAVYPLRCGSWLRLLWVRMMETSRERINGD